MASLTLKNIKKIYPHNGDEAKEAKKKKKRKVSLKKESLKNFWKKAWQRKETVI